MMHIGIIGTNHLYAGVKYREKLAKIFHNYFTSTKRNISNNGFLLLSTCNRTEVYYSSDKLDEVERNLIRMISNELGDEQKYLFRGIYSYKGYECFKHLSRVTAGLDSCITAETEIQGQVKSAYEEFNKMGCMTNEMHYLFQRSLKIGKFIRSKVFLNQPLPKIEHAVHNAIAQFHPNTEKQKVLFVGASDINRKIISYLRLKKYETITICNRSKHTACSFAKKFGIAELSWEELGDWVNYDVVIFGTKSQNYLIELQQECRVTSQKKLIIDLCIPRNVDPLIGEESHINLMDIDQLNGSLKDRKKHILELTHQAEMIVDESTAREMELFKKKRLRALLYTDRLANNQ